VLFQNTISSLSFKQWLWQDDENKRLSIFTITVMVTSFCWLKYIYPFPNFIPPDSDNYIEAATNNDFINIWPIGYSKFLRLTSVFTRSDSVLVTLQYLLLMASVLYFLFTIRYLLSPGKLLFRSLLAISIINPLLPHIANFVSSDCLFTILSLIWFTQLLWIIYQPAQKLLILHAVVLLMAFMVRFNALWYPLISITLISFINIPRKRKWLGIGSILSLLFIFIGRTQYEYQMKTGTVQYAAFAGWQLAANALYAYAYKQQAYSAKVPWKYEELHTLVNHHMDSLRPLSRRPDSQIGVYYLWDFKSPLRIYMEKYKDKNKKNRFFNQWASAAPLYASYGRWLITNHPWSFIKHYAWPNLIRYYAPPAYFMGKYNMENINVDPVVATWFDWKNNQLATRTSDKEIHIVSIFPNLLAILNPLFLLSAILFVCSISFRKCNKISKRVIICMLTIWFANAFFSILSAPIELRYQLFPVIITIPFSILFTTEIIQSLQEKSTKKIKNNIHSPEAAM
jgi:hypothetical protein